MLLGISAKVLIIISRVTLKKYLASSITL